MVYPLTYDVRIESDPISMNIGTGVYNRRTYSTA